MRFGKSWLLAASLASCDLEIDIVAREEPTETIPALGGAGGASPETVAGAESREVVPPLYPNLCPCSEGCGTCPDDNMIYVPHPEYPFSMDAHEVTGREYLMFLAAKQESNDKSSKHCSWNESFVPAVGSFEAFTERCTTEFNWDDWQVNYPERPVVCVDFCDAEAYCEWVGKTLCGPVRPETEPSLVVDDAELGRFFQACSEFGTRNYAYGEDFDPLACNTKDAEGGNILQDVGAYSTCEGPFPGLFDLSGNVAEWILACSTEDPLAEDRACLIGNAAFWIDDADQLACSAFFRATRTGTSNSIGFRCCRDEPPFQ